jgi:hypothetical protein
MEEFDMKNKLLTLCSSLRITPTLAFSTGSQKCKNLAQILDAELDQLRKSCKGEFKEEPTMMMIVDRNRDRITPLRLPWNYQAMMYEHLDYRNGRVKYGGIANKEANLSEVHDSFYSKNLFENLGKTIEQSTTLLKEAAKEQSMQHASLNTLQGMEYIAEKLPEVKKKANLAQKHFEIIEYLSELVREKKLLDISRLESEIIDTKLGVHTFDVKRKLT